LKRIRIPGPDARGMDADFPGRIQAPARRIRPDLPKVVLPSGREQPSIGTPTG